MDGIATVVFVDVEGSTALIERVGDGAGATAVRRQLDVVRNGLDRHGGREIKSLGDGLMLTFTSPRRAVTFAVEAQRALGDSRPRVRIGINSGEVLDGANDPVGTAVNLAARIAERADGGEVLVSDVVRQLVGSTTAATFVDRGRVRMKGFADRSHLWGVRDGSARTGGRATIGREAEVGAIHALLDAATQGVGGSLVIEGEAGIGKSHLVRSAAARAHALGMLVIAVTADEITPRPGLLPNAIGVAAVGVSDRPGLLPDVLTPTIADGAPSDLSFAMVEAGVEALDTLTRDRPGVVVVDDAQWADDVSLALLRALVRRAPTLPLAVLVVRRPTPTRPALDRLIDTVLDAGGARLTVGGLGEIDIHALTAAILGAAPGPGLRTWLASTSGNPLFVVELLRSMDDEGHLEIADGVADVDPDVVPAGLNDTLVRRLSWLPDDTRELLRLASLLGTSFTLADLAVITHRSVIDVAAGLRDASNSGLISGQGERLVFRHDLIREAVYGHVPLAERRDLHGAAARALGAAGAPVHQVAAQFGRGARPGDLEAVSWLVAAADDTASISPAAAIDLYDQALSLAPDQWAGRGAVLARMIEPLAWCGRFDRAEAAADEVLTTKPDDDVVFQTLRGMSAVYGNRGEIGAAIDTIHRSLAVPGAPADECAWMATFVVQLQLLTGAISADDARDTVSAALGRAETDGDVMGRCVAHQVLGAIESMSGNGGDAIRHARAAASLADSGRLRQTSYLIPDMFHAGELTELDEFDEAIRQSVRSRTRYERRGMLSQLPMGYMIAAATHVYAGRHDDADAEIEAGLAVVDDTGSLNFFLYFHALRARIAQRRGQLDDARAAVGAGMTQLTSGGPLFGVDWLLDAQARQLVAEGQPDDALALAATTWEQTGFMRHFYGAAERGVLLVQLATRSGRTDLAESAALDVEETARRRPTQSTRGSALQCRGLIDGDEATLLDAVDHFRRSPRRPALALCCEDAADATLDAGRAVELLREAAAIHHDTGATGDEARVMTRLRERGVRTGRSRSDRPASGWESLTPMEETVTALVAEGLTNPEIGARLYVSRRTVETHLSHVFRKLDCVGRAQLAADYVRRTASTA